MITPDILMKYFKKVEKISHPFYKYKVLCPAHNDTDPSLFIGLSKDEQRMKLICKAGCKESDIIEKGKISKELLIRNDPIAIWDYLNIDWEVEYKVYRYENPKRFIPYILNKKEEWEPVKKGSFKRILFNLPYINTTSEDEYIFFTEGEKDAENIRLRFGFCSTTTSGGSKAWAETEDMSILVGRKIIFLPDKDKDKTGIKYARQLANYLLKNVGAKEVRIIELPDLVDGEDVSDWINRGGNGPALMAMVKSSSSFASDVRSLLDNNENTGLVLDPRNSHQIMLEFSEGYYNGLVIHHKNFNRTYKDGIYAVLDEKTLKKAFFHFLSLSSQINMMNKKIEQFFSNNRITNNFISEFESFYSYPPTLEPPWWIENWEGLPNSKDLIVMKTNIFNLKKGEVMGPLNPNFASFHKLNFDFDPNAQCPIWLEFLHTLCKQDPRIAEVLQQIFGYLLSNSKKYEKMFLIVGPPRAGKGIIIHILTALLGKENCAFPQISQLGGQFSFAQFIDKTGIFFNDVRTNKFTLSTRAVELLLSLTSKDRISINRKHQDIAQFDLPGRVIITTNVVPQFNDPSGAIHTRIIDLLLTESFLGKEDPQLLQKLLEELPGIFNWALDGWNKLEDQGYFTTTESSEGIRSDLDSSQQVKQFIMQNYNFLDSLEDKTAYEYTFNLYSEYKLWCDPLGFIPGDISQFGRELSSIAHEFGIVSVRKTDKEKSKKIGRQIQERAWLGLRRKKGGFGEF